LYNCSVPHESAKGSYTMIHSAHSLLPLLFGWQYSTSQTKVRA
jgi:hypothetical protein